MPCYTPLQAWKTEAGSVVFHCGERSGAMYELKLPCGQCIGCRLERSRQWAVRCLHESKMHEQNSFITLTYDDANLPERWSLDYRDFQLFMKRLRKCAKHYTDEPVKFYMCGEYGPENGRPHYHACIFGFDFPDRKPIRTLDSGCRIFSSSILSSLWGKGYASIGNVTFESAAYVARYCVQKVTGAMSKFAYTRADPITGEIYEITPEFNKMSLNKAIGLSWLQVYAKDVYNGDEVIVRGKSTKPPRYYDKKLSKAFKGIQLSNEVEREVMAYENEHDNTPARLDVKHQVAKARFEQFKRREL